MPIRLENPKVALVDFNLNKFRLPIGM
jgi:T-complex protein 1 subunit alpha